MMRKVYQKTEEKANQLVWGFVIFLVITFCVLIKYGNFSTENKKEKRGKTAENGFHMKLIKTGSGKQNVINISLPGKLKHCG